ncbi:MAG TPA: ATP-binding protein [Streptosporangiales bacterium]
MWAKGRRPARRALTADAVLWLVLCLPVLVGAVAGGAPPWRIPVDVLAVAVVVTASRLYPPAAFLLAALATFADPNFVFALPVASFRIGRRLETIAPAAVLLVASGVVLTVALPLLGVGDMGWVDAMTVLLFGGVLPWLLGNSWRQYQALVHAGWERADQLEREQRMRAEQARLRERARIARDMHDSLGHELSLIALRAAALELDAGVGERHRAALGELRSGIADVTERLREVIGVLREGGEEGGAPPGHAALVDLVDRAVASGLDVRLEVAGEPGLLPPLVDRALYRIVQESLTNAARHAPGAATTVRLAYLPDGTSVTVEDDGPGAEPGDRAGGGYGLLGLRERVRLLGGEFAADDTDGGFRVTARLPHRGRAAASSGPAAETTESLRQRARAQRRFRRSLAVTFLVPAAPTVLVTLVVAAQYAYSAYTTTLTADRFARIRVGRTPAELAPLLPPRHAATPSSAMTPAAPAHSRCEFYRADRNPLNEPRMYRLCFAHGRLVGKALVHPLRPSTGG